MKLQMWMGMAMVALLAVSAEAAPRAKRYDQGYQQSAPARASSGGQRMAGGGHRMAGCGLGSMVVESSDKWSQVAAAFLNGTGMQTFGISFGTSNCTENGLAAAGRERDAFVEANLPDLRRDVAAGEGEYLTSLASLYGCQGEAAQGFSALMHRNQASVLSASPEQASAAIDAVAKNAACGA